MPRLHVTPSFVALCLTFAVLSARDLREKKVWPRADEPPQLAGEFNEENVDAWIRAFEAYANAQPAPLSWPWVIAAGLGVALVYTLSVLAHELGHYLAARRLRVAVGGITLHGAGGFVEFVDDDRLTRRRFALIVAAGPLVTALLALVAYPLSGLELPSSPAAVVAEHLITCALLVNAVGLAINLLPLRGLDGWLLLHSLRRA